MSLRLVWEVFRNTKLSMSRRNVSTWRGIKFSSSEKNNPFIFTLSALVSFWSVVTFSRSLICMNLVSICLRVLLNDLTGDFDREQELFHFPSSSSHSFATIWNKFVGFMTKVTVFTELRLTPNALISCLWRYNFKVWFICFSGSLFRFKFWCCNINFQW